MQPGSCLNALRLIRDSRSFLAKPSTVDYSYFLEGFAGRFAYSFGLLPGGGGTAPAGNVLPIAVAPPVAGRLACLDPQPNDFIMLSICSELLALISCENREPNPNE